MTTTLLAPRTPSRSRLPSLVEETGRVQSASAAGSTPPSPSLAGGTNANANANANTNTNTNANANANGLAMASMNGSGSLSLSLSLSHPAAGPGEDSSGIRVTSMSQPPSHSASVSSTTHPHNLLAPTHALGDASRRGSAYSAHPHRRSVVSTTTASHASHAPVTAPYAPSLAPSLPLHHAPALALSLTRSPLLRSLHSLARPFLPASLSHPNSRAGSAVHSFLPAASPPPLSPLTPQLLSIGACAAASVALLLALLAHALSAIIPHEVHNDHLASPLALPLLVPLVAAALILASTLDWYRTKEMASLVRRVAVSLNLVAFFGVWLLHPVWVVWAVPAVLFPLLFAPKATFGFASLCPVLVGLAYVLDYVDARPWDYSFPHPVPFLLFSMVSFLLFVEFFLRVVYAQFEATHDELSRALNSLRTQNRTLKSEIKELRNVQMEEVLGTPAEKAINILRSIISDPKVNMSETQKSDLHLIIRLIGSNKMYASNATYGNIKPAEGLDDETHKWVLDQLVQQNIDEPKQESEPEDVLIPGVPDDGSTEAADNIVAQVNRHAVDSNPKTKRIALMDPKAAQSKYMALYKMTDRLSDVLENVDNWNFDIIEFNQLVDGHALYVLGCYLLNRYQFPAEYGITDEVLRQFMAAIEEGYVDTPYHNALHAADVLQSFNSLICRGGLLKVLEPAEIFSCLFASIIHDFKHPGVNNNFLISTEDPLAVSFNDISVLENYHASEAFRLMTDERYGILKNVPKDIKKKIRKTSIELVLATDMSKHADIMGALKNSISVGELTGSTFDSRLLMMKMAVKLSDVSNPAKLPHIAQEWTRRITDEFYNQGDKEKERALPISPFMDRTQPVLSKSQIGFISFVVQPLAELWHSALNTGDECLHNLNMNLEYWKSRTEMEQPPQVPQAPQAPQPQVNSNPQPPRSPMIGKRPIPAINTSETSAPSANQALKPSPSMEIRPVTPSPATLTTK